MTVKKKPNPFMRWWRRAVKDTIGVIASFRDHITEHWPRYLLSSITASFTGQAAYALTQQPYYVVMAILLCEGMMLYWLTRLEVFENWKQQSIATLMFAVACVAIVATDISSAILIANANDRFQFYAQLPDWVQGIVTNVTPVLASSNLIMYGIYVFFADSNADKRDHAKRVRTVNRIVKASERDLQRLHARERVLRRRMIIERTQALHEKRYGKDLVSSVSNTMNLEMDNNDDKVGWVSRFVLRILGFFARRSM